MEQFGRYFNRNYTIRDDGTIRQSNGHTITPQALLIKYSGVLEESGATCNITVEQVEQYVKENTPKKEKEPDKDQPLTPQELLNLYWKSNKGHWTTGDSWNEINYYANSNTLSCPRSSDLEELANTISTWALNNRVSSMKPSTIRTALAVHAMHQAGVLLDKVFERIGYRKDMVDQCNACLDEIHGLWKISQSKEVFRCIMKHWIWSVKRKMRGNEVVWDIWPNFYGAQGTGKSTFIRKLCDPIGNFYSEPQISILSDITRERDKFTKLYVLNFDELTIGERSRFFGDERAVPKDLQAAVKQLMSARKMTTRTMGTQQQTVRRVTFTPISSANDHFYDLYYDDSGMRRFFEINCTLNKKELGKDYYAKKDDLQKRLPAIWQGVDDNLINGYFNTDCAEWDEIRAAQEAYYPTKTTTSLWVENRPIVIGGPERTDDMYKNYRRWCQDNGYNSRNYGNWFNDLKHIFPELKVYRGEANIEEGGEEC